MGLFSPWNKPILEARGTMAAAAGGSGWQGSSAQAHELRGAGETGLLLGKWGAGTWKSRWQWLLWSLTHPPDLSHPRLPAHLMETAGLR